MKRALEEAAQAVGRWLIWLIRQVWRPLRWVGRKFRTISFAEYLGLFAAVVVAIWATLYAAGISNHIDQAGVARARADACRAAIVTMHDKLMTLRRGYDLDRSAKPERLADWDDAIDAVLLVKFSCTDQSKAKRYAFSEYTAEVPLVRYQHDIAYQGLWDETDVVKLINWSNAVIESLK